MNTTQVIIVALLAMICVLLGLFLGSRRQQNPAPQTPQLEPVTAYLNRLNDQLKAVEKQQASFGAQLSEQVRTVVSTNENLRRETGALSNALRKPQVRGQWGELQLKRVVELAGMVDHCNFYTQDSVSTVDGRLRPDMKVLLGDGKFVYVDAKTPLTSFLDAQLSEDEAAKARLLAQFGNAVRSHVDQLSAKRYWRLDANSPEFVVLFLPSEALAAEALSQQPDLIEYAAERDVILASPTTLIAMLRAVSYGWKQAALADSAREVFETGRELYDRLGTLSNHLAKLGKSLTTSVKSYNDAIGSLESRVLVTARKFNEMKLADSGLEGPQALTASARQLQASELTSDSSD